MSEDKMVIVRYMARRYTVEVMNLLYTLGELNCNDADFLRDIYENGIRNSNPSILRNPRLSGNPFNGPPTRGN